jgi:hypothetical protein
MQRIAPHPIRDRTTATNCPAATSAFCAVGIKQL